LASQAALDSFYYASFKTAFHPDERETFLLKMIAEKHMEVEEYE